MMKKLNQDVTNPVFIEVHRLAKFHPSSTDVNVIFDLMIHDIDIVTSLIKDKIKKISAFGKKIFSVWGNTIPEFGMYPYMAHEDSRIIEVKDLNCRPCSKIGFSKCPKGHFNCMEEINENLFLSK